LDRRDKFSEPPLPSRRNLPQRRRERIENRSGAFHILFKADKFLDQMHCPQCSAENPAGAKFCSECASPMAAKCPRCGASGKPGAKFCNECAAPLASNGAKSLAQPESTPSVRVTFGETAANVEGGERKFVTALFADIKGSTELEQDLDPEEARAIVDPALKLMIDAVRRYDGYVVQSTGDGIFAIFGAPVAHEDHPQRSLYAAIRMQEELRRYSTKLVAEGGKPLPRRRQHRGSCRAIDLNRRRPRRVHSHRAYHEPRLANAGRGSSRIDRSRRTYAQTMRGLLRAAGAGTDQGQGRHRSGQRL
jgi:hypothetical protein